MEMKPFYKRSMGYVLLMALMVAVPFVIYLQAPITEYHFLGFLRIKASSAGHVYCFGVIMGILTTIPWGIELFLRMRKNAPRTHKHDD